MKKETDLNLYTLNTDFLKRGDIILTTSKDKTSKLIRFLTFGPFSHAMIYLGGESCSDAGGPGIRVASHNTQRIFFESTNHCCVLRIKEGLEENQIDNIINYARRMIGVEYSIEEAKLVALRVKYSAKEINRQFCSRYVAQAYENAGIDLVKNSDYCSPVNLYNSELLTIVKNHLRIASEKEIEVLNKESIPLSAKDYADEYMFSNAKKVSGLDIQTAEQFNRALINLPQFDSQFSQILIDSGFLDLWSLEKKENPWFYDFKLLEVKVNDIDYLRYIGNKQLPVENELQRGWKLTLQTLNNSYAKNQLNTLKLQIELYNKLIELSNERISIWRQCQSK